MKLRSGQIEVANYRNGYMAVPAVPGAGKTTVLAYLAADLIEKGYIGRGKILIVTYMNSAVANFRAKIGDYLEERGLSRSRGYDVRTLHSLALSILKEKPELLLINDEFNIIDSAARGKLIQQLIDEWLRNNSREFLKYFDYRPGSRGYQNALKRWNEDDFPKMIKSMIAQFKLFGLGCEEFKRLRTEGDDSYLKWSISIYQEYDKAMKYQGLLDFDDLVIQALKLLKKDQQLRERLGKKYTYIFEDEAQDSNQLLSEIILLLAGNNGNLLRIGDSNQAIMGTFTNANPLIFRNFASKKRVEKCSILYSSRSTKDIINLANYLIKWTINNHPQEESRDALEEKYIYPVGSDDPFPNPYTSNYTVTANIFKNSQDEIEKIAYLAARHVKENPENTAAILLPANFLIDNIIGELEDLDAEYETLGGQLRDKLQTIEISKKALYYLVEPNQKESFIRLFKEIFSKDHIKDDCSLDFIEELMENYTIEEIIYPIGGSISLQESISGIVPEENLSAFRNTLAKLNTWIDASVKLPPDELILFNC